MKLLIRNFAKYIAFDRFKIKYPIQISFFLYIDWNALSISGVVGQEPVLFRGTIHDNIAIGCPEATREEVQRVAEMAYAHDFILRLPNVC